VTTQIKCETLQWVGDHNGHLILIDQTQLPGEISMLECKDIETVWEAIKNLRVRGAPAIGIAAAYGVVIGLQRDSGDTVDQLLARLDTVATYLAESRPTAVNLFWALDRMRRMATQSNESNVETLKATLLDEARAIHDEDRQMCHAIGRFGAELLNDGDSVLTHCNAGGLATSEYGTALSVFFTAQDQGKSFHVFVDETRPLLQGARLTAWELAQRGIDATLICDSMAAQVMSQGKVQAVVTGADRIASNGDSANKIGTYSLAVLAKHHGIPFYIAAPSSTFDLSIPNGSEIPIEERSSLEITNGFGKQTAPDGIKVYNPAFDVTPAHLIRAIITEKGLIDPVTPQNIRDIIGTSS
jgi:methylthioribose-1-phosphate isomerase